MAANGAHDYPNLAAFAAAATAGLLAIASRRRELWQFREWLCWATVERCGLEPETHKLLDLMAGAAVPKPQDPKPENPEKQA